MENILSKLRSVYRYALVTRATELLEQMLLSGKENKVVNVSYDNFVEESENLIVEAKRFGTEIRVTVFNNGHGASEMSVAEIDTLTLENFVATEAIVFDGIARGMVLEIDSDDRLKNE